MLFHRPSSTVYCLSLILGAAITQAAPVAIADRAVDMVTLVGGEQLLGAFASPPADGLVTVYVSRDWLRKRQPALYRKLTADEDQRRKLALTQYVDRLEAWRERRTEPKLLNHFIERSIRDIQSQLRALDDPDRKSEFSQLVTVELPTVQVRRHFAQSQSARRLLGLAWEARLANAEELSVAAIAEQLKAQDVDVDQAMPDLSDRFDLVPLSDRQWAAKVALIEFKILGKPHFQGTGGVLLRDDGDGARPPLSELVSGMIQDQLGDALGDLLNPQPGRGDAGPKAKQQAAIDKALAAARDEGSTGVRITYLDQSLQNRRVTVSDTFYARLPNDNWQPIWQFSTSVGIGDAKEVGEDKIAADPQVAEILTALKALGLDANNDLLKSALRFGAATQQAMQETELQFADYLLAQTRRLVGPPVPLPATK
jgi:hypothetical protein